jgi:hypothetical protein
MMRERAPERGKLIEESNGQNRYLQAVIKIKVFIYKNKCM